MLVNILEHIPVAFYGVIIGLTISALIWITFRLFRPYPAGLAPEQLNEVQNLESKFRVILVAYDTKREYGEDELGGPSSFFDG